MAILEVSHVKKIYTTRFGGNQVEALKQVSFSVEAGEYVAIMGESGSGKTTLLNILAALDRPTAGEVRLNGQRMGDIREKNWRRSVGKIWVLYSRISTYWIHFPCGTIFFCRWFFPVYLIKKWKPGWNLWRKNWR